MAAIDLTTADKVNVIWTNSQITVPAASNVTAGAPCYLNSSGKAAHSDANATPTLSAVFGIAVKTVLAGEAVTLVRNGMMSGWDLTNLAYGAKVYVSDTVARIDDGESAVTGLTVGTVVPCFDVPIGTAADKYLLIEINADTD